jgi:hypothetical protein
MTQRHSLLVLSVWCPKTIPYLDDPFFLCIWEICYYYLIEYIFYVFSLWLGALWSVSPRDF